MKSETYTDFHTVSVSSAILAQQSNEARASRWRLIPPFKARLKPLPQIYRKLHFTQIQDAPSYQHPRDHPTRQPA